MTFYGTHQSNKLDNLINYFKVKKRSILLVIVVLTFVNIFAQEQQAQNSESIIVMSEDDINSLVKTLKAYKTKKKQKAYNSPQLKLDDVQRKSITSNSDFETQYLRNEIKKLEQQLAQTNNSNSSLNKSYNDDVTASLQERELKNLKYELEQLRSRLNYNSPRDNSDMVVVTPANQGNYLPAQRETIIRETSSANNDDNKLVRAKLDSLNLLFKSMQNNSGDNYGEDFTALENRIEALKNELLAKNNAPTAYDALVSKYKGFSKAIYFDNNSTLLNKESQVLIDELFTILNENDNIDVVVKGFASNKGNALYNESLSMKRTEAVKKALILKGIHPTRVLTQYHGIDYSASKDIYARRVELSVLIRK